MIAIIDYGMGNLRSVQKALEKVGATAAITDKAEDVLSAQKVVLPGVGAMAPAMHKLNEKGLIDVIKQTAADNKPFLGICLGYQLLFNESDEGSNTRGLGILEGSVKRFESLKVPHMGWNQLNVKKSECPLFNNINGSSETYFCHSYYVIPDDKNIVSTTTEYGIEFASSVCRDNLYAVQFHPEKSQTIGLQILENFVKV